MVCKMNKYIIATGTVTYALKGRDVLRRNGFKAYVERSTDKNRIGCGYTIRVTGEADKISEVLQKAGVKVLDVKRVSE